MKIYISGAITNNPNYREQFEKAEMWLKSKGHEVVNPASIDNLPLSYSEHLLLDFRLIEFCDCVYFIDGWQKSKGAVAEHSFATAIGKKIKFENKQWALRKEKGNENDKSF